MKLIVFPGNPGKQYEKTRHNLPRMVLKAFTLNKQVTWKKKFNALWAKDTSNGETVVLLKPEVFMNNTGKSVQSAAAFFKIPPSEIFVLHDDIELPFGYVSLKKGGGAAGHNGLRSIIQILGSSDFYRIRLGISRPEREKVASYVLGRFSQEEEAELSLFTAAAADFTKACVLSQNEVPADFFKKTHFSEEKQHHVK